MKIVDLPVLLLGFSAFYAALITIHNFYATQLLSKDTRDVYINELRHPRLLKIYQHLLKAGLDFLDYLFGSRHVLHVKALFFSITVSVLYIVGVFAIVWIFGGTGSLGGLSLFREDTSVVGRILLVAGTPMAVWLTFWIYPRTTNMIDTFIENRKRRGTPVINEKFISSIVIIILMVIPIILTLYIFTGFDELRSALLIAIIVMSVVIGLFLFAISWPIACLLLGIYLLEGNHPVLIDGLFVIGVPFIVAVISIIADLIMRNPHTIESAVTFIPSYIPSIMRKYGLFYVAVLSLAGIATLTGYIINISARLVAVVFFILVLPLANGIMDWLSWAVSRMLARIILRRISWGVVLSHIVIDGIIAVIFLAILAFAMTYTAGGFNWQVAKSHDVPPMLPVKELVDSTYANPFGVEGFWITFMLLSTLFPTSLHLLAVLVAALTLLAPKKLRNRLADQAIEKTTGWVLDAAWFFTLRWFIALGFMILVVWSALKILIEVGPDYAKWLWQLAHHALEAAL